MEGDKVYEDLRAARIARNEQMLKELGVLGGGIVKSSGSKRNSVPKSTKRKREKEIPSRSTPIITRRSRRSQNLPPEINNGEVTVDGKGIELEVKENVKLRSEIETVAELIRAVLLDLQDNLEKEHHNFHLDINAENEENTDGINSEEKSIKTQVESLLKSEFQMLELDTIGDRFEDTADVKKENVKVEKKSRRSSRRSASKEEPEEVLIDAKSENARANALIDLDLDKLDRFDVRVQDVAKVVGDGRILNLTFLNNPQPILISASSSGQLSIWNTQTQRESSLKSTKVCGITIQAHDRGITTVKPHPIEPSKVFTSSYDGSVRVLDLSLSQIMDIVADPSTRTSSIGKSADSYSFTSLDLIAKSAGNHIAVSDSYGRLIFTDLRTNALNSSAIVEGNKKINTVVCNPMNENMIATSDRDARIALYDIRHLKKSMLEHSLNRVQTHIQWSPSGRNLVSIGYDDRIHVWNGILNGKNRSNFIPNHSIAHNNQTGRWLTPFKLCFLPTSMNSSQEYFLLPSLKRTLQLFSVQSTNESKQNPLELIWERGGYDHTAITAVMSINSVYSYGECNTKNLMFASGVASGRCYIWRY